MKTLVVAVAVVVLVLVAGRWLPVTYEEPLVEGEGATVMVLKPGGSKVQTVKFEGQTVAGLVVISPDKVGANWLVANARDGEGKEISQSVWSWGSRLWLTPFSVNEDELVAIEIENRSRRSLRLQVFENNPYPFGQEKEDLALVARYVRRDNEGRYWGLLVGCLMLGGLWGLTYWKRWRLLVAFGLLAVTVPLAVGGFWWSDGNLGISDWDYYFTTHHFLRQVVVEWGGVPWWNPWSCGGTAAWADPEFSGITPAGWMELVLGVPRGLKVALGVHLVMVAWGMVMLARRLGWSVGGGVVAGMLVALNGSVILRLVEGHITTLAYAWVPWVLWAWLNSYQANRKQRWQWVFIVGLGLALMFWQGAIQLVAMVALVLLVLPLLTTKRWLALQLTLTAGAWSLGLSAVKLVPVLQWVRQFPDEAWASSAATWRYWPQIFLGRYSHGAEVLALQGSGWHEYGAFIGWVALALVVLGSWQGRKSRLILMLAISAGVALVVSSLGPWLKPVLEDLSWLPRSNVSRLVILVVVPLALLAGKGIEALPRRWRWLAAGLMAIELFSWTYPVSEQAFVVSSGEDRLEPASGPLAFTRETFPIRIAGVDYTRSVIAAEAGYGTMSYCNVLGPRSRVVAVGDKGDWGVVTVEGDAGQAELISWEPTRVIVRANLSRPATVTLNSNFAKGWSANKGELINSGGRIGVALPAGSNEVEIKYWVPGLKLGAVASGATLLLMATIWLRGVSRRGKRPRA